MYREFRNKVISFFGNFLKIIIKKICFKKDKDILFGKWWRIVKLIVKILKKYEFILFMKVYGRIYFYIRDKVNVFNKFFSKIFILDNEFDLLF